MTTNVEKTQGIFFDYPEKVVTTVEKWDILRGNATPPEMVSM
jgi:hypothetical protein